MNDQEEYVLSRRLGAGALPAEDALAHAIGLAYAMRREHQAGSLCGRLTPERIVIAQGGVRIEPDGSETLWPGAYTSPEELQGEDADVRSDIFTFGAILYEMLVGRAAFAGRDCDELRRQIVEHEPEPVEGLPGPVRRLLARCLEKRRDRRWQHMSAVVIELKLAAAMARQVQQVSDWNERMASLRAQLMGVDSKVSAAQSAHDAVAAELRDTIRRLEEQTRDSLAGLQKSSQVQARAIEGLEAAVVQTDEVLEHVVDAFGMTQKPQVERAEAVVVSRNGH